VSFPCRSTALSRLLVQMSKGDRMRQRRSGRRTCAPSSRCFKYGPPDGRFQLRSVECRTASHKSPWILGSESLRNRNDFASGPGRIDVSADKCLLRHTTPVLQRVSPRRNCGPPPGPVTRPRIRQPRPATVPAVCLGSPPPVADSDPAATSGPRYQLRPGTRTPGSRCARPAAGNSPTAPRRRTGRR
jgi:hypothetical protein